MRALGTGAGAFAALAVFASLTATACRSISRDSKRDVTTEKTARGAAKGDADATLHAVVPSDTGPFYPSLARIRGDKPADVSVLSDTADCAGCHVDAAAQWQSSAHAHASFDNPWYRAVVDKVRAEVGNQASRHCAGCHDPMLLFSGQMDTEIAPDNLMAVGGVTCMLCHGIAETRPDGNASYTLVTERVPPPVPGDAASLARHRAQVALNPLKTAGLCASCHRGFLGRHTGIPHHLSGIEEPGAWRASPWAGSRANVFDQVEPKTCQGCHMQKVPARLGDSGAHDGKIASHRFAGAHTALASLVQDEAQLSALEASLRSAITVDVPAIWEGGRLYAFEAAPQPSPENEIAFDVVIRNTGVGHQFPGGVKDMQDTWVEVDVTDASGRVIAQGGAEQSEREDPTAYVLRTLIVDAEGRAETQHIVNRFGSVAFDHTVAPLHARVIRYSVEVPKGALLPLGVSARVRHRRHRKEARELACEASRSDRGKGFEATTRRVGAPPLDGCKPEPITLVASFRGVMGQGSAPNQTKEGTDPTATPLYWRLYAHAFGLSANVQERLGEAKESVDLALATLDRSASRDDRARAALLALAGRISGRQGRVDEALQFANQAEALIGAHPALDRVRGDAYGQTWRWSEAATMLARVTEKAPGDTAAWRDLARALMSTGGPRAAYDAALAGLKLQPRDEGLLRCEALALEALQSPEAATARAAFLYYREADETSASRLLCDERTPRCARDRQPVVTIELASSGPRAQGQRRVSSR